MGDIHQQFNDIRTQRLQAKYGDLADSSPAAIRSFTGINKAPQAANVWTVEASTVSNSATYTLVVNGATITYTADGSATAAEIGAGFTAAIKASPLAYAACTVADGGAGTITLTGRFPGFSLTVTSSDAKLTLVEATAEADAASIEFGDAVIYTSASDEGHYIARADGAYLAAQVDTHTFTNTYSAGEVISAWVEVPGYPRASASVIAATDLDTSLAALTTALNASIDANISTTGGVTAAYTAGSNLLTLTAQQAGKGFKSSAWGTTNTVAYTTTSGNILTDASRAIAGIAKRRVDTKTSTSATVGSAVTSYGPNEGVQVLNEARVWVKAASAPSSLTSGVWLGLATSERGKFFTSAAATRVFIPSDKAKWSRPERSGGSDGIAVLSLNVLA